MDFTSSNAVGYLIIGITILYLIARLFMGFRFRIKRPGNAKLSEAETAQLTAEARQLALTLEAAAATALSLAEETAATPDAPLDIPKLEFSIPGRFKGDTRKLERMAPPYGPLAALAARKAQGMQHRLYDPNWEPMQRREGADTPAIYRRLAREFETAAAQARRVEKLLHDENLSPFRAKLAAKRRG